MTSLTGKVAIVTGAAAPQGIGRAISLRLAEEGARVVMGDIDGLLDVDGQGRDKGDLLARTVADIRRAGGAALAVKLDVTNPSDIAHCIAQTVSHFGRVDILVNNAGSLAGADWFMSTTPEQWDMSFRVNILGPMMMAQAAIPEMRKVGGGRIINIGSTGSLGAEPGFGA